MTESRRDKSQPTLQRSFQAAVNARKASAPHPTRQMSPPGMIEAPIIDADVDFDEPPPAPQTVAENLSRYSFRPQASHPPVASPMTRTLNTASVPVTPQARQQPRAPDVKSETKPTPAPAVGKGIDVSSSSSQRGTLMDFFGRSSPKTPTSTSTSAPTGFRTVKTEPMLRKRPAPPGRMIVLVRSISYLPWQ
jgi:hypothetical protein